MGVAVHTPAVDVSDEAALRAFLDRYAAEGWPPIRGVIHAAVALDNQLAGAMDARSLQHGHALEAAGARSCWTGCCRTSTFSSCSRRSARFCRIRASPTTRPPMPGSMRWRRIGGREGAPAMSIAWGPWENAGLALGEAGERAVVEMGRLGIQAIPTRARRCPVPWLCGAPAATVVVMPADWARFQQVRSGRPGALFRALLAGLLARRAEAVGLGRPTGEASAPSNGGRCSNVQCGVRLGMC